MALTPDSYRFEDEIRSKLLDSLRRWFTSRALPRLLRWICRITPVYRIPILGTVVVTGFDAYQDAQEKSDQFAVPSQPKTDAMGWQPTFLLAMPDSGAYQEFLATTRELWNYREDDAFLAELVHASASGCMEDVNPDLPFEVVQGLIEPLLVDVIEQYYGVEIPEEEQRAFLDAGLRVGGYLFGGASYSEPDAARMKEVAQFMWGPIGRALDRARPPPNSVIARYNALGRDPEVGTMKSFLMGMISGTIPVFINSAGRVLMVLSRNNKRLNYAVQAREDEDALLRVLQEAMRFNYILPALWRRATVAESIRTGRGEKEFRVRPGSVLLMSAQAAMFDRRMKGRVWCGRPLMAPGEFDPKRGELFQYGHGLHYCVGDWIGNRMLVAMYQALLPYRPVRRFWHGLANDWAGMYPRCVKVNLTAPGADR